MKKMAVIVALAVVGCSSAHEEDEARAPEDMPSDPVEDFSSEGLTVERSEKNRVAGVFTRDGATLRFDISRDGDTRRMVLTSSAGEPLVESTFAGGIDTAVYFGGKAKATGRPNEEPKREGDEALFQTLATSDARIFPELKEALYAAKIDRGIFLTVESPPASSVRPQMYQAWASGDVWTFLGWNGDWWGFWSWSGWGITTVIVGNAGTNQGYGVVDWNAFHYGYVSAYVQAGCCASEWVSGTGSKAISRRWWGAYITVTNKLTPIQNCYWQQVQVATECSSAWSPQCRPVYNYVWTCGPYEAQKIIVRKY